VDKAATDAGEFQLRRAADIVGIQPPGRCRK
jgi:hypothetical protein